MSDIKVSIIVAVYNAEMTLERCLHSLVNQTLKEIEIICVNDASTDNSLKLLQKWSIVDKRIKVISYMNNMRQGYARNVGIKHSKGKYIGIVDSDDFIDSRMYEALLANSCGMTSDLVMSDSYYSFNEGESCLVRNVRPELKDVYEIKKECIAHGAAMWTNIVKREFLFRNNLSYPVNIQYEDNVFNPIVYLLANDIQIVHQGFYYYCVNPSSTIHKKNNPFIFDRLVASRMFLESMFKLNLYKQWQEEIDYYFYRVFLFNTYLGIINTYDDLPISRMKRITNDYLSVAGLSITRNSYFRESLQSLDERILCYACLHPFATRLIYIYMYYLKIISLIARVLK